MTRFLLVLFLMVSYQTIDCKAQSNDKGDAQWLSYYSSKWETLVRPSIKNPLNIFYRFVSKEGKYYFQTKISMSGESFIVKRGAPLELLLGPEYGAAEKVVFSSPTYKRSCLGCGSRSTNGDMQGVTITYPIEKSTLERMQQYFIQHVSIELNEDLIAGSTPTLVRAEHFRDQVTAFLKEVNRN